MIRNLPPLGLLRAFEATARLGSITAAALELSRTHGAVSRQVQQLQIRTGLTLFEKAGTGLRLTEQGAAFAKLVAETFDRLEGGYRNLLDAARGPGVHVACSATFAMRWLVPHLSGFYARHPDVKVRLSMTSAREIRHQDADVVIAWDWPSWPPNDQANAVRIGDVAFGLVHAQGYPLTDDGWTVRFPTRIAHDFTSRAWDLWPRKRPRPLVWDSEISFPHTHLCVEAALSGLGVALVQERLVRDELMSGRLIAPFGFQDFEPGLAAIAAPARGQSPQVQAFVEWLRDALV